MIRGEIAVRNLAAFLFKAGDLYPVRSGKQVDAEQGIRMQQRVQASRREELPGYRAEVVVGRKVELAGRPRRISGRIDGLYTENGRLVLEEFKCCGVFPDEPDPVDMGQLYLYGCLRAADDEQTATQADQEICLRLIYVQVDTADEMLFETRISVARACADLAMLLLCVDVRLARHRDRTYQRRNWAEQLEFPMPEFRTAQQALARRSYQTLAVGDDLLLEAPTGSGKTLGVLFPAVKAQTDNEQIFFLTSRNAGARAALSAAVQLDPDRAVLVSVELTAKDKVCFVEGAPCDASVCPYAQGYFERVDEAVNALLSRRFCDRTSIEHVAREYMVCPFELGLDTSIWADLVVGDYNYLLDPIVHLQRFAEHDELHVLIDEAHQLSPRTRDMLKVEVTKRQVRQARKCNSSALRKPVESVNRALLKLRKEYGEGESQVAEVKSLQRAMERLVGEVAELEAGLEQYPEIADLYFAAVRWARSEGWYHEETFAQYVEVRQQDIAVRRICLDPAPYIRHVLDTHKSNIRFSGTISPLPLYQRLHGYPGGGAARAESPFTASQVCVLIVPDVPTYYRQRAAGVSRLCGLLDGLLGAGRGRYLIALPSYAYLDLAAQAFAERYPLVPMFIQQRGLDAAGTDDLLGRFATASHGLLFIVSGGLLGESVDFSDMSLSGVVLVGLGLPPPSLERDLLAEYFDESEGAGWGQMVAYTQPALVKNVQAAGRLVRGPEDAGIICLVDARFANPSVQGFFPDYWQPEIITHDQAATRAKDFWQNLVPGSRNRTVAPN